VRRWSAAINRNDNAAAAALFAPGAVIVQTSVYRLVTRQAAVVWNASLPCAGHVADMRMLERAVLVTFTLANRPRHRCDAPGARAAAIFGIAEGLIRIWQQVPPPGPAAPLPPGPSTSPASTSPSV